MTSYDLPLAISYVKDWTEQEAIRELFQNALDQGDWTFVVDNNNIHVCNKNAVLSKASMLLGHSDKKDGSIGKFGEGYKLALLVLVRLGYKIKINNHACNEEWTPRLKHSRKFGASLLSIDVQKKFFAKSKPKLEIIVYDVADKIDFTKILWLCPEINWTGEDSLETVYGKVLLKPEFKGRIYIKGLWVCDIENLQYGYSFEPNYVELDRDRRMLSTFNVCWLTSKIWVELDDYDSIKQLVYTQAPDVQYIDQTLDLKANAKEKLTNRLMRDFHVEHGYDAVPVATQQDIDLLKSGAVGHKHFIPIVINPLRKDLLSRSSAYKAARVEIVAAASITPREQLQALRKEHGWSFNANFAAAFDELIEASANWRLKHAEECPEED